MRRYSLTYFIGQSIKGLWRNGVMSVASITVLMSCLAVVGGFALLVLNINYNLEEIGVFNEIVVFIDKEKTPEESLEIGAQILSLDNVAAADFVSRDEAYAQQAEEFAEYSGIMETLEDEEENIYPDKYIITYIDSAKISTLEYQLNHIDGIYKVSCRTDIAERMDSLKNGIILIFSWFLVVLFVVSVFVIINTIKLAVFARRQEISIMRYVGATNWFIVLPFVFEGILIGIVSSVFAFFIEWYLYVYIQKMINSDFNMFSVIEFGDVRSMVIIGFLGIGILTGILGSCISLSKYLKA